MCCALLVFFAAACVATDTEAHVQDQIHAPQGDNNALHAEVATLKAKLKAKGAESDAKVAAIKAAIPAKQLASIMTAARVERCPGDTPASVLNGAARCTSSLGLGGNDGPAKQLVGEGAVGFDWKQCKSEVCCSPSLSSLPQLPLPATVTVTLFCEAIIFLTCCSP